MFGDIAQTLLGMMGMTGRVPAALNAEDIPTARERLLAALAVHVPEPPPEPPAEDTPPARPPEEPVPLKNRALPLLQLLEAAQKRNTYVMWETVT